MMLPIQSSMFSHIGWDNDTLYLRMLPTKKQAAQGELGDLWRYPNYVHGLPAEPPAAPAEGWGKWWHGKIKGQYEGEKVTEASDDLTATLGGSGYVLGFGVEEGRSPDSVSFTKTPVSTSVQPVMPDDAVVARHPDAKMLDLNSDDNWDGPIDGNS